MKKTAAIPLVIGAIVIVLSLIFLKDLSAIRNLVIVISLIFMIVPTVVSFNKDIKMQKEKEQKFLEFVRDIVENVRAGTPISNAIINIRNRDYGALKNHVIKLANQVYMGIPLTIAFETFARESKSPVISRSISLIAEANRSGGEMNTILSSVASSVNQTETIQKERRAAISNLIVQGYIIFLVFILIVLVLQFFLMPLIDGIGPMKDLNIEVSAKENIDFSKSLFFLLITQSFFSGLVIGKISEGKLSAGVKHSFILVSLSLILSTLGEVIFGKG